MSFPKYPKYKPSGVEWLGDVPEHWDLKPLRSIFNFSKGLTITKEDLQDEGISCVNYGEIHSKYGFRVDPTIHPLRCVATEYQHSNPDALLRNGDFVFADTSEDLEGSGNFTHLTSNQPVFAGYHTIIGRPHKGVCPLFLAYQFHSPVLRSQIQSHVKGIKVFSISQAILKSVKCWLPSRDEQSAIASFLDRETSKIDSLVGEQRRLIELLKEKRQAVISHAVTKGLNPNAPLKPSGIQWLGDVPEHWEVLAFRRIMSRVVVGIAEAATHAYADEGVPIVRSTNIKSGVIDQSDMLFVNPAFAEKLDSKALHARDIVTTRTGANVGVSAVVPDSLHLSQCFTLLISSPGPEANPHFYNYFINAGPGRIYIEITAWGSGQPNISVPILQEMHTILPPLDEQERIVAFLDVETAKLDALTTEAERAIELLQERRTALISAAVTGKIDVRQFVSKEAVG